MLRKFWESWKKFGQWIGDMLARIVLTLFYFTIFLPFGIGVRFFGDPLSVKHRPAALWLPRATLDNAMDDVRRQF